MQDMEDLYVKLSSKVDMHDRLSQTTGMLDLPLRIEPQVDDQVGFQADKGPNHT